jgi:ketosteroid isomerase-like protein
MLALLDPNTQWELSGPSEIPWAGSFRGHDGVEKFLAAISANVEIERFEPRSFIAQDEQVVVLGFEKVRVKQTGRVFEVHWAHAYTLSGGKIATLREYTDTAATSAAFHK